MNNMNMQRPRFVVLLLVLLGTAGRCMAIESPKYTVELSEKPFEIRQYAPSIVANVHMDGDRSDAVSAGFRILASYIFGDNQLKEKLAMTAPVTQSSSVKIPMTAPVQQEAARGGWDIRFVMPAAYTLNTLPKPGDARITLVAIPGRRTAAIAFTGFWSDSNFKSHQEQLSQFLVKHSLTAVAAPIYAYYNAPWTPWFLRTNEVIVEIVSTASATHPG